MLLESEDRVAEADYGRRLAAARARIAAADLDGLLVSSPHNRRYLTGMSAADGDITESAGWALVTPKTFALIAGTFHLNGVEHEIVPSGVRVLRNDEALSESLVAQVAADDGMRRLGFEKEWLSYLRYERLRTATGAETELVPADDLIEHVRAQKDAAEIATMRRAAEVAERAFAQLLGQIRLGMTERQIAALLDRLMIDQGASGTSFDTIVACGPGGALPHAVAGDREVRAGEPLLIDFGCRVDGYCSDCTRTFCLGEPDPKLVEIYAIVREAQNAGMAALRAGERRGRAVDAAAREVIERAGYKDQFFHGLGHGVGLAIHELPKATWLKINTPEMDAELAKVETIPTNSVVTNEPGIYIPGWGGVRLEDMLLVGEREVEPFVARNPETILAITG